MKKVKVEVIRADGLHEHHEVEGGAGLLARLYPLAGCDTFDAVNLRNGYMMLVDDNGYETKVVEHGDQPGDPTSDSPIKRGPHFLIEQRPVRARKPVNPEATKLYWSVCAPGTTHQIVGDVVLVRDEDFR